MLKRKNELKQQVKFLESENKRLQNSNKWMKAHMIDLLNREWFNKRPTRRGELPAF